ncbi:uncharacterized protein LTR77_011147 [Saxophila tyrrhenica]|uniref:Uncharacterized protein n=1 Tax=Saxophila tyrrhenica TaxID=1690608 RepID=A0AAV9NUB0_9PEZI|nr:hypothetical protein LTR77_011147 [Saxophila tyrrhenica]
MREGVRHYTRDNHVRSVHATPAPVYPPQRHQPPPGHYGPHHDPYPPSPQHVYYTQSRDSASSDQSNAQKKRTDKNMEKIFELVRDQTVEIRCIRTWLIDVFHLLKLQGNTTWVTNGGTQLGGFVERGLSTDGELEIQMSGMDCHQTAPHRLILLWPSVRSLLRDANVDVGDSYVMEAEDCGILQSWSRGEDNHENNGTQPGGSASPAPRDDKRGHHNTNNPSPPHNSWGTGFQHAPSSDASWSEPLGKGGLRPDGTLDLDVIAINSLYDSYMKNMHVMHPFLEKQQVREIFDSFISRYGTTQTTLPTNFAVGNTSDPERPLKRQRSNGSTATGTMHQEERTGRRELTERSPTDVIVWLILALGKICAHKDDLAGIVPDRASHANTALLHSLTGNSGLTNISPTSVAIKSNGMSPSTPPVARPIPTRVEDLMQSDMHSRRPSTHGAPPSSKLRNLDKVPGLAYYAKAAEILGNQADGNDLIHAQMFLLAGLYKGQLARVKESMSWYVMAGRAIRMLLNRYKLYNDRYRDSHGGIRKVQESGQMRMKDRRLIVLASWTCLQLESDILAEMRFPSSGIGALENRLLMPDYMSENEEEEESHAKIMPYDDSTPSNFDANLRHYRSQIILHRLLNRFHIDMHSDKCLNLPLSEVRGMLKAHEDVLKDWRCTLAPGLKWDDKDAPAVDILPAQLRAKYYDARYFINRPFLDYALHIMPHVKDGGTIADCGKYCNGNPRDKAEVHLFEAIGQFSEDEIWNASKRCIDAAMQSTIAFDRVPPRLIVTNIHGTAHAQLGNMLVVSAAYRNKWLNSFIEPEQLKKLLRRTIVFCRKIAKISLTSKVDCMILERIDHMIFGPLDEE